MKLTNVLVKRTLSLLLALLMLTSLSVFSFAQDNMDTLTDEKINEISSRFPETVYGCRYYGTYNGYDIVYIDDGEPAFMVVTDVVIAGYTFTFGNSRGPYCFYAYKDGRFIYVMDAYDMGYLSRNNIREIHKSFTGVNESDAEREEVIRRDFAAYCAEHYGKNVSFEDVYISEYYGYFNGYEAFRIAFKAEESDYPFLNIATYVETIAGCTFTCYSNAPHYGITLYQGGDFITLSDAYATFLVTKKDVGQIWMKEVSGGLFDLLAVEYIDYLNYNGSGYNSLTANDIVIEKYFGNYGSGGKDCHVVLIRPKNWVGTDDILELEIGGYTFTLPSGSMIKNFLVYKDGEFSRIKDAFENGVISQEQISELYEHCFAKEETEWKNPFIDVDESSWYYSSVEYVNTNGLFVGVSDDKFAPGTVMTKNMFITVLWSNACKPILSPSYGYGIYPMPGDSISHDAWYYQPLRWAAINGIIQNNEYRSSVPILRGEIMKILYEYYRLIDPEAPVMSKEEVDTILSVYPDIDGPASGNDYMRLAAAWAVKNGLIVGIPQGDEIYLSVDTTATRAQVATIIKNFTLKF